MVRIHRSAAVALAAVSTATCTADFNGLVVLDLGEIVPGTTTYQFFANFDDPSDRVLSVGSGDSQGQSVDFEFHNGNPLVQVTVLPGSGLHDTPAVSPISGPGDSWVTIGGDWSNGMTDTEFSPGFLGGGGGDLIAGTSLLESDGGYFDANPGTPENGGSVLIAQFTVESLTTFFRFGGVVHYETDSGGPDSGAFLIQIPAASGLGLFSLGGLRGARRRRR